MDMSGEDEKGDPNGDPKTPLPMGVFVPGIRNAYGHSLRQAFPKGRKETQVLLMDFLEHSPPTGSLSSSWAEILWRLALS